jgi:integrase
MASLRTLKSGLHQVRWRERDGDRLVERAKSFTAKKDALAHLAVVDRLEEIGQAFQPDARTDRAPSIDDGIEHYIENLKRSREALTVRHYETAWALFGDFMADEFDDALTVDVFSRDLLAAFYDWLTESKDRSLDTRHRYVEQIRRAWSWLWENEYHASIPRPRKLEMKRDRPGAVFAPTFEEMAACVRHCVSVGPRRLATVLYYTGLRTSQAEYLSWDAVDLKRGTLNVEPHKGLPGRLIPLSPHFLAELESWGKRPGLNVTGWGVADQTARSCLLEAWARAEVRPEVWQGAPGKAFRKGLTSGLKQLGADRETAELYVGRGVQGARARYLDMGTVPFEPIAKLIPPIESGRLLHFKREKRA